MATLASDPLLRRSTRKVARTYKAAVTTSIASADRTPATMRAPQKAPIRKIFRPTVSKSEVPPATNASTTPKVCVSEPPDLQQLCISQAQLILTLNHDVARHLRRITELEMLCTSQGSPVQGATIISREPALQSLRSDTIPTAALPGEHRILRPHHQQTFSDTSGHYSGSHRRLPSTCSYQVKFSHLHILVLTK